MTDVKVSFSEYNSFLITSFSFVIYYPGIPPEGVECKLLML